MRKTKWNKKLQEIREREALKEIEKRKKIRADEEEADPERIKHVSQSRNRSVAAPAAVRNRN